MRDDNKTRKVESTEYDTFMLSLEGIANLRYNNEFKLSTNRLNKEENKNIKKHIKNMKNIY